MFDPIQCVICDTTNVPPYCFMNITYVSLHCRSFENNLKTYKLLAHRKPESELPTVSHLTNCSVESFDSVFSFGCFWFSQIKYQSSSCVKCSSPSLWVCILRSSAVTPGSDYVALLCFTAVHHVSSTNHSGSLCRRQEPGDPLDKTWHIRVTGITLTSRPS